MSTVPEIERAIEQLPPDELARLRAWFAKFDAAPSERRSFHVRSPRLADPSQSTDFRKQVVELPVDMLFLGKAFRGH
jgi:hypothetical protein